MWGAIIGGVFIVIILAIGGENVSAAIGGVVTLLTLAVGGQALKDYKSAKPNQS